MRINGKKIGKRIIFSISLATRRRKPSFFFTGSFDILHRDLSIFCEFSSFFALFSSPCDLAVLINASIAVLASSLNNIGWLMTTSAILSVLSAFISSPTAF